MAASPMNNRASTGSTVPFRQPYGHGSVPKCSFDEASRPQIGEKKLVQGKQLSQDETLQ
ncbi:hypothetical protein SESBI_02988 [Sesbania bispinosa]|nr:hypothetical protein SESBI_02988 [Sesbania bispinosa]